MRPCRTARLRIREIGIPHIKHLNNSYTNSYIIPPTYCPSLFCLFYSYNYIYFIQGCARNYLKELLMQRQMKGWGYQLSGSLINAHLVNISFPENYRLHVRAIVRRHLRRVAIILLDSNVLWRTPRYWYWIPDVDPRSQDMGAEKI